MDTSTILGLCGVAAFFVAMILLSTYQGNQGSDG